MFLVWYGSPQMDLEGIDLSVFDPTQNTDNCEPCQGATVRLDHESDGGLSVNVDRPIQDETWTGEPTRPASLPKETLLKVGWTNGHHVHEDDAELAHVKAYALEVIGHIKT